MIRFSLLNRLLGSGRCWLSGPSRLTGYRLFSGFLHLVLVLAVLMAFWWGGHVFGEPVEIRHIFGTRCGWAGLCNRDLLQHAWRAGDLQ